MKRIICLTVCAVLLAGCAAAETVTLPNSRYVIDVPDSMVYSPAVDTDYGMEAYYSETLEMDYASYPVSQATELGMPETLREAAEDRAAQGLDVELRKINGIETLCYRVKDETDGAPCIGYVFIDGEWMVEIDFWYATQEAADMTKAIMETIREKE